MSERKVILAINKIKEELDKDSLGNFIIKSLENALKIHEKFPPTHSYSTLEKFDKLLMNLSEEYVELQEEVNKVMSFSRHDYKDFLFELTDIIDYSFTIIMVLLSSEEVESNNFTVEELKEFIKFNFKFPFDGAVKKEELFSTEPTICKLVKEFSEQYLMNVKERRNWSNRKWHKPEKVDMKNDFAVILEIVRINIDYIRRYLSYFSILAEENGEELLSNKEIFQYYIFYKQESILNL